MTSKDYLQGVNKTWKKADGLVEQRHCHLALIEEVGEIAGWLKKVHGYGRPKDEKIKTELKGEFGDLLYYLFKTAEMSNNLDSLVNTIKSTESSLRERMVFKADKEYSIVYLMASIAAEVATTSYDTIEYSDALCELAELLTMLVVANGYSIEDIMYSNLAKLASRHGSSFKDTTILEEGRDREEETRALNK